MADLKNLGGVVSAQFRGLNGRHPGQWPFIPSLLCGMGALVVVLGLGWFFYWSTQLDELAAGRQQEEKLKEAYKSKVQQAINLEALRKQKEQVGEKETTQKKQKPNKTEKKTLLSD